MKKCSFGKLIFSWKDEMIIPSTKDSIREIKNKKGCSSILRTVIFWRKNYTERKNKNPRQVCTKSSNLVIMRNIENWNNYVWKITENLLVNHLKSNSFFQRWVMPLLWANIDIFIFLISRNDTIRIQPTFTDPCRSNFLRGFHSGTHLVCFESLIKMWYLYDRFLNVFESIEDL